jgi:hypothetical protein
MVRLALDPEAYPRRVVQPGRVIEALNQLEDGRGQIGSDLPVRPLGCCGISRYLLGVAKTASAKSVVEHDSTTRIGSAIPGLAERQSEHPAAWSEHGIVSFARQATGGDRRHREAQDRSSAQDSAAGV